MDSNLDTRAHRIGDVARQFGVTLRAIRFYEDRGMLAPQRRGTTRLYSDADVARLGRILRLAGFGFTLVEVMQMIDKPEDEGFVVALNGRHNDVAAELRRMFRVMREIQDYRSEIKNRLAAAATERTQQTGQDEAA